MERYPR